MPTSYVGIPPLRYELVIECDGRPHDRMQTGSFDTANRELLKELPKGHEWHVVMFIDGVRAASRTTFNR